MHDATADEAKANNAMEAGGGAPSSTMEDIPVGNTADTLVNTASSPDYTIQKSASVGPSIASKVCDVRVISTKHKQQRQQVP